MNDEQNGTEVGCTMQLTTREAWELAFILHRFANVVEAVWSVGPESSRDAGMARRIAAKVPHGYGDTARRILRGTSPPSPTPENAR